MKITEIEPLPVQTDEASFLLVVVHTDEGLHGLGEIGMRSRPHAVLGALRDLSGLAVGEDPSRIEHLGQVLRRGGFFPAVGDTAAVIAAVDIALWDLRGKALGAPLYDLLGGRVRDHVPAYVHLLGREPDELIANAHRLIEQGWRHLRIGLEDRPGPAFEPRRAVRRTLGVLHELREAVGDEVELLVDVHTRLDPAEAAWFCREVEAVRPYFVEDPLRAENLESYRTLRRATGVPLAAGEQLTDLWEFRPLIEGELVDHARVDLANTGITGGRKIAAMCEAHHIQVATHNPLGPVCTAASAHVNLALPNISVQEQSRPYGWGGFVLAGPQVEGGQVAPADLPGLGVEIDLAAARRVAPASMGSPPRLRRADGSFTNW